MKFRKHYQLKGQHAFLSPSNSSWTNYDESKLIKVFNNHLNVKRGTKLHDIACQLIEEKIHLPALVAIGTQGISLTKRPPSEKAIAPSNTSHRP